MVKLTSPIAPSDSRYADAYDFLLHEAELLDRGLFTEWLDMLADDLIYRMPVTLNTRHHSGQSSYSDQSDIFSDNLASLKVRVNKLSTDYAWAETPASRTRHFVSNVRVREGASKSEIEVTSYLLLYRNRGSNPDADLYSGERQDLLRKDGASWRLAKRTILLDQAVVGGNHLAIFF